MKTITLLSVLCFIALASSAQQFIWAQNYFKPSFSDPYITSAGISAMTADKYGNAYTAGMYYDSTVIGGYTNSTPYNSGSSLNQLDWFISRTRPDGHTDWVLVPHFATDTLSQYVYYGDSVGGISAMCASPNSGTVYFGAEYVSYPTLNPVLPYSGGVIGAVDSLGNISTVCSIVAQPNDFDHVNVYMITATDSLLYIEGSNEDSTWFGPYVVAPENNISGISYYIACYDLYAHQFRWARKALSLGNLANISGIQGDNSGNLYVAGGIGPIPVPGGYISDSSIFDSHTLVCDSGGGYGFIAKINASGQYQWARRVGSNGDNGFGLAMDGAQNLWYAGQNTFYLPSGGPPTIQGRLIKYDTAGNMLWQNTLPYAVGWQGFGINRRGVYISTGSKDTVYASADTVVIGAGSMGVVCLDTSGHFRWYAQAHPSNGSCYYNNFAISGHGEVYMGGSFYGTLSIGSALLIDAGGDPLWDQYVALLYTGTDTPSGSAVISGRVYFDLNANCILDSADYGAPHWAVTATPGNFTTVTDSAGYYSLFVPAGSYSVAALIPVSDVDPATLLCPGAGSYSTGALSAGAVDSANDFSLQAGTCTYVTPAVTGSYNNTINCNIPFTTPLQFCNYSLLAADSVIVSVLVSDSIHDVSTMPPFDSTDISTGALIFRNMILPPDTCINIMLYGRHDCNHADSMLLQQGWNLTYSIYISLQSPDNCTVAGNLLSDSLSLLIPSYIAYGIAPITGAGDIKVYPDPFSSVLYIEIPGTDGTITISDIAGRQLSTQSIHGESKTSLDLSSLSAGLYTLTWTSSAGSVSRLISKE